jgi:hypothetical protein
MNDTFLIWWVTSCSGGLCDRILGLVTTHCISKCTKRKFLIKWDHEDLKIYNKIFSINPLYNYYNFNVPFINLLHDNNYQKFYFKTKDIEKEWGGTNICTWSNQNLFQYTKYYNSTIFLDSLQTLFQELLIINKNIQVNIPENCVGIHLRTHDNQIYNKDKREAQLPYIRNKLKMCYDEIVKNKNINTIFIASDCDLSFEETKKMFEPDYNVIQNDGVIIHTCELTTHKKDIDNTEGLNLVFKDLFSLSKCKTLYIAWNSNYSRIGALLNTDREIYCYEHPTSPEKITKCTKNDLCEYFSTGNRM